MNIFFKDFDIQSLNLYENEKVINFNSYKQAVIQNKISSADNASQDQFHVQDEVHYAENIDLYMLCNGIRMSNNSGNYFEMQYKPDEYTNYSFNTEGFTDPVTNNYIRLKAELTAINGKISVEHYDAKIDLNFDFNEEKNRYHIYFFYSKNNPDNLIGKQAIVLETNTYEEFRNLNLFLGYGDISKYKDDTDYITDTFAKALKKATSAKELVYLYNDCPDFVLDGLQNKITFDGFLSHLTVLSDYDDDGWFSGWRDGSFTIIQIFKALKKPDKILSYFSKDPSLLNRIYYNLDGNSYVNSTPVPNRKLMVNMIWVLCLSSGFKDLKNTGKTLKIGNGYKVNSEITGLGNILGLGKSNKDQFFLQQQQEVTKQETTYLPSEMGGGSDTHTVTKTQDSEEGSYYYPLDIVTLIDDTGGQTETYQVPAIYIKELADSQKKLEVEQDLRIAGDLLAVIIGILTLPEGNPYLFLLAAGDVALAGADLSFQAFREEILKVKGGKEFLETWEKIYATGTAITGGVLLVTTLYKTGLKLLTLPEVIKNIKLKNTVKTYMLNALLNLNILTFEKNTVKLLEPQELFLGTEYKAMGNRMAENGVIFVSGRKAERKFLDVYAAVYNGEVIEEFTKAEMHNFYKKWGKLQGEELIKELEYEGGAFGNKSVVETSVEAEVKAFEEGEIQFANKTIAKPFDKIKEAISYFNHHVVGNIVKQLGEDNCGNVAKVIAEYLRTGELKLAEDSLQQGLEKVAEKCGAGRFSDVTGLDRLEFLLRDDEIAILYGARKYHSSGLVEGHYLVAVKVEKKIYLLEGQTGEILLYDKTSIETKNFERGYRQFKYTKAGKIKK